MSDSTPTPAGQRQSWRDRYPVHPAADLFPMMSDEELDELGKDIKKNGLRQPVVQWRSRDGILLIDGRNRLEAIERAGLWQAMRNAQSTTGSQRWPNPDYEHGDPVAYVMSANIRRRHLTREQKRDVIAALLKLAPERSDRQVARDVGVDHKTVGVVRRQGEERGEIPHAEERVDTSGRSYAVATREPYAVEAERAAIAEADRTLHELAEQQRDLKDVDRRLTRAEAKVERREAADNDIPDADIPDAEVIDDALPKSVDEARARTLKAVDEAREREGNPAKPGKRRHVPMKPKPHPKGLARDFGPWVTVCANCGHDLYRNPRLDDAIGDFAALFNASVVGLPERVAA